MTLHITPTRYQAARASFISYLLQGPFLTYNTQNGRQHPAN